MASASDFSNVYTIAIRLLIAAWEAPRKPVHVLTSQLHRAIPLLSIANDIIILEMW